MSKKESFIRGTLILAAAALVARVLGLVQRIPLEHMLNDVGDASFSIANNVYLALLTIATAGIPSTLSKMVSERYALGKRAEAERVYHAALIFSAVMGVIITIVLYVLAPFYAANISKQPEAALSLRALAPALLLFPTIAMMRGYFQGRNMMTAGGISQIVEQFLRVGTGIALGYVLLYSGYNDKWIAAGASFGGVLGSIGAFAVMIYYSVKLRQDDKAALLRDGTSGALIPMRQIYVDIFKISIPIVLSSLAVPAVNMIDSSIVKPLLLGAMGEAQATEALGILGARAQSIAGIPPILAIALSTSLIPIISAAFARKDEEHLRNQITLAMRISILTGMPIVIILCAAAYSLNGLIFSSLGGSEIIGVLTFGTIFQITMMTSNSILIGVGKTNLTMKHVLAGIAVKLISSYALAKWLGVYGIYGIIVSTGLCFLVITILNVRALKTIVPFSILGGRWAGFVITVILLGAAGFGLNEAGIQLVDMMPARLAFFIACCLVGMVVLALYPVLLILFRVVRENELSSYPKVLQKVLRPLMKLQRSRSVG
ncbi:polysaccharide biosynthesis protein [Paenibacillus sediminis]|uniref:Stage V sporulation protein B n=1 Tax=Paenibacillus sediminis TaxID=664909 RepID=A0ABS4H5W5_9BACL|nr:polysaccharide biosynthesis protein [Paenibacillus sediminis]MBP1937939.1 stage V sporulation protein B [Paenibacillus sediminis]